MVYNAARLKDAGQPFPQQAAMAKLFSSQVADRITSQCLELFGGYGYSKEYPGGEVLPRRQDRHDLRGHQQHAAADHRQGDAEVASPRWSREGSPGPPRAASRSAPSRRAGPTWHRRPAPPRRAAGHPIAAPPRVSHFPRLQQGPDSAGLPRRAAASPAELLRAAESARSRSTEPGAARRNALSVGASTRDAGGVAQRGARRILSDQTEKHRCSGRSGRRSPGGRELFAPDSPTPPHVHLAVRLVSSAASSTG